jgi:NTP pyrophosphatase (non-canonical NTP hydrolase)
MKALNEVFAQAVKNQIGGNKDHGWGQKDSMGVIDELLAECSEQIAKDKGASEELLSLIGQVVNPSAFRQTLERAKVLNKGEGRTAKVEGWLDALKG